VIYVPEGFEVREGLKLTEDYKVNSVHLQGTVNLIPFQQCFTAKGSNVIPLSSLSFVSFI
jgi:hypothetical protein